MFKKLYVSVVLMRKIILRPKGFSEFLTRKKVCRFIPAVFISVNRKQEHKIVHKTHIYLTRITLIMLVRILKLLLIQFDKKTRQTNI